MALRARFLGFIFSR